jgi:hypothetical protein
LRAGGRLFFGSFIARCSSIGSGRFYCGGFISGVGPVGRSQGPVTIMRFPVLAGNCADTVAQLVNVIASNLII